MVCAKEALPLSLALAGKTLVLPTDLSTGATNWICVPPLLTPPAQFLIQVVRMSAQACGLASQQLWPPATLMTIRDWSGCDRLTTPSASLYARFTSSERANIGDCPPALWQLPQRLLLLMFCHRLIRKACTSAVAGAGPEELAEVTVCGLGLDVVAAPHEQAFSARTRQTSSSCETQD